MYNSDMSDEPLPLALKLQAMNLERAGFPERVFCLGMTEDGLRFDTSQIKAEGLRCLNCGCVGSTPMFVEGACPQCKSTACEPIG